MLAVCEAAGHELTDDWITGTPDPPPPTRLALKGYLAFFGAVLDEARAAGTPREEVLGILGETLVAALAAADRSAAA